MTNNRKKIVLDYLNEINKGVTAKDIALALSLDRANVSRYLNELYKENQLEKITGRPVLYQSIAVNENEQEEYSKMNAFSRLIGYEASLKEVVQQAKAAILYPQWIAYDYFWSNRNRKIAICRMYVPICD
ncbi:FaeA/PapI family transcriptional regulator [Carnobacterium viridans]|uniref:FaeA/PapI family transcriptional regulator n=1 Tax=Carnobacterium viridans TaxID=174587 RepID=UPI00226B2306|nr:FaeA/PapI family transcriptional regulator [Carnobacterium viridans]